MTLSQLFRVFAIHVGFHTFWVLLYASSLLGLFALVPLVGWYNAFVLGFIGNSVLASAAWAVLVGYLVFAVTGLLSGCVISLVRPKSVWIPACLSLALTGVLLVGLTMARYRMMGSSGLQTILQIPATSGRADADEMAMALKDAYLSAGELPPYFAGKGGSTVALSEIQPLLPLLSQGFQLQGGPYVYCNLPSQVWRGLSKGKYPLLWSTQPDATGKRLVITADLMTGLIIDEVLAQETFAQMRAQLEMNVRKQTSDANFVLPE
jgi:hypothetical protein